jgi:signal transduction histidine kinase
MKRRSIATKITLLFLGALLLNGASIIFINLYQTSTMYTNEYDQEIREIAMKFRDNNVVSGATQDFNQLSSYNLYLKLAYEPNVDRAFMTAANVQFLRQTPNQTAIINERGDNYIAALFPINENELIIMKKIPLLNERSTPILTYSIITVMALSMPLLIIMFIVLRRFTKPIVEMNNISESYAESDFTRQVAVTSNDEIGQLAMSLNQMAVRLQAKEVARDTFLAGVSHELRTPLTTLKANTSGIIEGIVPQEKANHFLASNIEEIDRMIRMVNDLILVSTFEQNLSLNWQKVSLQRLIDHVLRSMELFAHNKHVQFMVNCEESLEIMIDQEKCKQVFMNLLHNAIQHSPRGGTVYVEAQQSNDRVSITIRDEGRGFRVEQIEHVFERFYRDQHSTGLGLGLYISKKIIEAHHGTLSVGNHPAGGADIEMVIPKI